MVLTLIIEHTMEGQARDYISSNRINCLICQSCLKTIIRGRRVLMETKGYKLFIKKSLDIISPIMGVFILNALYGFTRMHIKFFPADIPIANLEIKLLLISLVLFIISMYYKSKISRVIFFICIVWGELNIAGYVVASLLYDRGLYLDKFI